MVKQHEIDSFIDILSIDHQIVWSQQNCRGGWTQMSVSAVKEQLLNGFDFVLKLFRTHHLYYLGGILVTIVC